MCFNLILVTLHTDKSSNQAVDLGKGNRLWQKIDNPHGTVIYHIEYA
jgi:hypothetical protein